MSQVAGVAMRVPAASLLYDEIPMSLHRRFLKASERAGPRWPSVSMAERAARVAEHYASPISREAVGLQTRFKRLAAQWRGEVRFSSSASEIAMNPAYQQIIGMGPSVVPLIMDELKEEPDHWFWALKAVTGADPVEPDEAGDVEAMSARWLVWGKEAGFIR